MPPLILLSPKAYCNSTVEGTTAGGSVSVGISANVVKAEPADDPGQPIVKQHRCGKTHNRVAGQI